jgi:hypothetical protein
MICSTLKPAIRFYAEEPNLAACGFADQRLSIREAASENTESALRV